MIKINKHIEILSSNKKGLGSMGVKSRSAVLAVLSRHYTKVGITIANNLSDLEELVKLNPDLVFMGMKFVPMDLELGLQDPNKIWVSEYLEEHDIAYTGSSRISQELEHNKHSAKRRVMDAGFSTAPFYVSKQGQVQNWGDMAMPFPLFIKPTNQGGGLGIDSNSVVNNFVELEAKVSSIADELKSDSLLEEYLEGREFSVAILKTVNSTKFLVMPIELTTEQNNRGARILSKQVKTSNSEKVLEVTDPILRARIVSLAINVFHSLGARDYGRIDIRLNKNGVPQFLEANLIPSLISGYGSFPKACLLNINMGYETMILNIVELGLARNLDSLFSTVLPILA